MAEIIAENTQMIGLVADLFMVLIWLIYLQLFFFTIRNQRRPALHIDRGAAKDETARLTITNVGRAPIYLVAIVVDIGQRDGTSRALVTDRSEIGQEDVNAPLERTNQGPLHPGTALDIGSLSDILSRAQRRLTATVGLEAVDQMWVSAVALSHEGGRLMAANKSFSIEHNSDRTVLITPDTVLTEQLRSPFRRRELLEWLEDRDTV